MGVSYFNPWLEAIRYRIEWARPKGLALSLFMPKKPDKPLKIELPYEDAVKAFMRTPPPKKRKAAKKKANK